MLFLAATILALPSTSLYGIQVTTSSFSGSDPVITFETGSTALPTISGLQFSEKVSKRCQSQLLKKVSKKVSVPAIVENDYPFKQFEFSIFSIATTNSRIMRQTHLWLN
jgi:hypothetical protein